MIKIYIDEQNTRKKFRVRVMHGNIVLVAFYADNKDEAIRLKNFARKIVNGIRGDLL